ncbi:MULTISPECIES: MFS transporter [Mumia]|uniref:MFS transporter n=1 Tax=Mumia xiangluensis TaxID=1678900 RepID=A0ABW1QJG3_9ACTN|nr:MULTISPECIES: MFS transporter [Mumia]
MIRTRDRHPVPPWATVGVLAVTGVLAALQGTLLLPLVSQLPEIYGVGTVGASWIITATMLAGALATPIVSRLADMYGKRRLVVLALGVLLVGSVLLALTEDYVVALVGRTLQGVTASVLPVSMSILKDVLPPERVGSGIALVSATLGIGSAVGLPLAGLLYGSLGYSSLFWLVSGFAGLLALAAWWLLPRGESAGEKERFDWVGAALLAMGLVPLLLVLSQGNTWGWGSATTLSFLVAAVVAFAVWVPWELRTHEPVIDLRLTARRPVLLTNIASMIIALGLLSNLLLASLQFGSPAETEAGLGLTAGQTGLAMALPAAVFVVAAPMLGLLLRRYGGRLVLLAGSLTMAVAYSLRVVLDDSVVHVVLGSVLIGAGSTLAMAAMPMIIMSAVPRRHTASANGVNSLCRMIGTSASTAALAALTTATAVVVAGHEVPTPTTIHITCWVLAGAGLAATVLVWFIPRDHEHVERDAVPASSSTAVPLTGAIICFPFAPTTTGIPRKRVRSR